MRFGNPFLRNYHRHNSMAEKIRRAKGHPPVNCCAYHTRVRLKFMRHMFHKGVPGGPHPTWGCPVAGCGFRMFRGRYN